MRTKLATQPKMDERMSVALPADEKARLFDLAARRNTTPSQLLREAARKIVTEMAA